MEDSDEGLVERARSGDTGAFKAMIESHGPRLYSFLVGRLRSREAAEDAYAEAWMRVWKGLPAYRSRGKFLPWLFTIAHRLSLDVLERESRRPTLSMDAMPADEGLAPSERFPSGEPGPEREAMGRQAAARVRLVLDALPEEQRQVFLLREFGGLTFAQIADVMDCPLSTALARMRYAVLKLREELEEFHA
ncbi:MAG: sigma-70 family RNA polymerase sigma factor [Elusimicrobia bacterium]|nr:sigma-70 family RNA polymerase sigma factor [Elusimicrobiota bacterium]